MDFVSAEPHATSLTTLDYDQEIPAQPDSAERRRLIDLYDREYRVVPADSEERRRAAHRLRYQVYCLENPFEERDEHPEGFERDEYDSHSVQSVLQRRSDGVPIGTVRLILPVQERAGNCLPFHRICRPIVPLLDLLLPIQTMAEVSRFCISKELRRRTAAGNPGGKQAGRIAELTRYATLGLIRSLVENSVEYGITHWCLVVEPALLRFLASLGFQLHAIGPLVEHHGRRQPCHADLATLLDGVLERRPDVWEVVTDEGRLVPAVTGQVAAARSKRRASGREFLASEPAGAVDFMKAALAVA